MDAAACVGEDPELFFPAGKRRWHSADLDAARQVCQACPIRTQCLERALKVGAEFGIWAGTTPLERKRIGRRAEAARKRRRESVSRALEATRSASAR